MWVDGLWIYGDGVGDWADGVSVVVRREVPC